MRRYRAFTLALLFDVAGAAGALLISLRHWQTISLERPVPLHEVVFGVPGRTIDSAPTAFALVALAGVVAVLATRGFVRRLIGGVLVVAGAGLVWRALASAAAVSSGRARLLVADKRSSVDLTGLTPHASAHPLWPALTVLCGLSVTAAGVLLAWRGHHWQVMSARYEAPDPERDRARAATTMWSALDRGEDPTG